MGGGSHLLDKNKIKDSLTVYDVKLVLKRLGSEEVKEDSKGNPIFQTVCHHGSKQKLYYYKESKMFKCYTDCGDSFDIYELVCRNKKIGFYNAVKFVAETTGKRYSSSKESEDDGHLIDDWDILSKFKQKKNKEVKKLPVYSEHILEVFLDIAHESWVDEGISYETCKAYNIGYYLEEDRITIPHFDIDGRLVGVRGRTTRPEEEENGKKYMPVQVQGKVLRHQTALNLYGLHKNKDTISNLEKCVLFEGEKSVLKCHEFYGDRNFSLALGGSQISDIHLRILLKLGVREVIVGYDKEFYDESDKLAKLQEKKIKKVVSKLTPYFRVFVIWDDEGLLDYKDAPVDKGKETLERLMKNKIEVLTF